MLGAGPKSAVGLAGSTEPSPPDAVRVLTEAARRTRTVGAGTGEEHTEPADFAEFVTLALAGAAANIGTIEAMLAGRPGSWEADSVRQMLASTVGHDEQCLLEHRTNPLKVTVHVDDILNDLGYADLYYVDAQDELQRPEQATGVASYTSQEQAAQANAPTPEQEAALERLDALTDQLEEQREREWAAYGEKFKAAVLRHAVDLLPKLKVPVEVVVELNWHNSLGVGDELTGPAALLWENARMVTPLPGSGIAPKDYPLATPIAQVERDAVRLPLNRIDDAGQTE